MYLISIKTTVFNLLYVIHTFHRTSRCMVASSLYLLSLLIIIRKSECEELGLEANTKAVLEDVGHNADLYIANQEDNTQN